MNWKSFNEPPKLGTRFVALYTDGSGAGVFLLNDKGALVTAEGDYLGKTGEAWFGDAVFSFWAELPELVGMAGNHGSLGGGLR